MVKKLDGYDSILDKLVAHDTSLAESAKKINYYAVPESFGAKGDSITNDSVAFQNAINSFNGKSGKLILDPTKTYALASTVTVPYNVSIEGNLCTIIPIAGGTFTNNFMFYVNADLSTKAAIQTWGGDIISKIRNIRFNNPNVIANIKAFYTKGKTNFEECTTNSFYKFLLKEGTQDADYSDNITIKSIYSINCLGTEPQIEIKYNGDGLLIDNCHMAGVASGNYNHISLTFCQGGKVQRCLNGDYTFNKCFGMSFENAHIEHGKVTSVSSQVTFKDIYQWYNKTYQPIPLTITNSGSSPTTPCIIQNYIIIHIQGKTDLAKNYTDAEYFDAYFNNANIKISNFFRRSSMALTDVSLGMSSGVKISTNGTVINANWNKANQLYSKESYVSGDQFFTPLHEAVCNTNFTAFNPALTNHGTFDEALTTYYYQAFFYFGFSDRLVGRWGGGEKTATITSTSQLPVLSFQYLSLSQISKVRIFRGTASGQYSHYVDVPIGDGFNGLYDYGYFMSTGERWTIRTAGTYDAYNSAYTKVRIKGENVEVYGTAIPTSGTWTVGDRIINTTIASGQVKAWICSVAGTPGTWLSEGTY